MKKSSHEELVLLGKKALEVYEKIYDPSENCEDALQAMKELRQERELKKKLKPK